MRTFDMVEQRTDVIVSEARLWTTQSAGRHLKGRRRLDRLALGQGCAQVLIDDNFERPPAMTGLSLEACGNILIEGQGGSHVMMLQSKHHDV
jgi:hypothetical protein